MIMHSALNWELQKDKVSASLRKFSPLLIFLFFVILTVLFTFPSVLHLNSKIIGDGGDNYLYFGYQSIFSSQIKTGLMPFSFSTVLRFPFGFPLYRAYDSFFGIFIGGTLSLLMNPVLAYNLAVIILLSLNGYLSYLLFKYISKKEIPGVIGGTIYGLSFYSIGRSNGHIGLMFTAGFTLFLYAVLKNIDSVTKKNIMYLCLSVLLITASSFQYLLFLFILLLVGVPILYILFPKEWISFFSMLFHKFLEVWTVIVPFIIVFLILTGPLILSYASGSFIQADRSAAFKEYSPSITEYFIPNKYLATPINIITDVINTNPSSIERVSYIGMGEIILFIMYVIFYKKNKNVKRLLLLIFCIFFILSLGFFSSDLNIYLPYNFLYKYFPFSSIPEASRYSVFYLIPISIGIVLFISSIKNGFMVFIILILLIFERTTIVAKLSNIPSSKDYVKKVANLPYSGVLDIPISWESTYVNTLPLYYNKPIVGGAFHWSADDKNARIFTLNSVANNLLCPNKTNVSTDLNGFMDHLKYNNVNIVVVHKNDPEDHLKFYFPECAGVRMQSSLIFPQLFMPNVTEKAQIMSLFFPAVEGIGDTVVFPNEGTFFIDGFHIFPVDWLPLHAYLDGKEVSIPQIWTNKGGKNVTQNVKMVFNVKKGSRLRFAFDKHNNTDYSFVKLWYRYESSEKSSEIINSTEKIYEDEDAAVFKIN